MCAGHSAAAAYDNGRVVVTDPAVTRRAYAAWIVVCLVWGTTYLAIRVALETIPPALLGGLRFSAAGALLALLIRVRGGRLPPPRRWGPLAVLGLLLIGIGNGFVVWAEQWVPSGVAAVVVASVPFWMIGIEAAIPGGERITLRALVGLAIGFVGILLLVWPDLTAGGAWGHQFGIGVIALQVACVGWSLGSAYSKRLGEQDDALASSALQMLFGGVAMLIFGTFRGEWSDLSFSTRTLIAEIYLTGVGAIAGYSAYVYALRHLPMSTVSLYAYVNPVIAVIAGTLVLGEPFGARVVAASAMVLGGIAVVRTTRA